MTRTERYRAVLDYFQEHIPEPETELIYDNPYQLLVAVVLSAQCTDKRVNMVTPALFAAYPTVQDLSKATVEEIFGYIRSISYPNNKAKHLAGLSALLMEEFDGEIPLDVAQLIRLPGVGRKTANVVTSVLDAQPNMAVDTHVFRVSARIGLTYRAKNVLEAERQLIKFIPEELVHKAHHWLILHGRYVCLARRPLCEKCGITSLCKYFLSQKK